MPKYYYNVWTGEDDRMLQEIMTSGYAQRKKTLVLFNEAAIALGRTAKSCQNRWYEIKAREAV